MKAIMKSWLRSTWMIVLLLPVVMAEGQTRNFYEVRTYQMTDNAQVGMMDKYLSKAMLPALHKKGYENIGVFKEIGIDTAAKKRIFVIISATSVDGLPSLSYDAYSDKRNKRKGKSFWMATHDHPPYDRMSISILKSFEMMPNLHRPKFETSDAEQVFELRSYEAKTEHLTRVKVKMFNEGGEMKIFSNLGFNAVFYGHVLSGPGMPNLMYMTSFKDMDDRNEHWDAFRKAPAWLKLKEDETYSNSFSRADIYLLSPTKYSDL